MLIRKPKMLRFTGIVLSGFYIPVFVKDNIVMLSLYKLEDLNFKVAL